MTLPAMPNAPAPSAPVAAAAPARPSPAQMQQMAMAQAAARRRAMGAAGRMGPGPNRAEGGPIKAKDKAKKYAKGGSVAPSGGSKGTTMRTTTKRSFKLPKANGAPGKAGRGDGVAQRGRTKAKIV